MIIVKNRELLIPGNERYIGTTYDTEVENRLFCLDRFNQSGFDLSNLTFRLDMKYPSTRKVYTFNATTSRTGRSVVILTKSYVAAYPYAGTVTFTFNGTAWSDGSQTVDLEDIGVSIAFTPNNGDTITVISTINSVNSDTVLLTKEISPNHIYLTWEITESQTAVAGTVFVSLRGFNEDVEQRYASFPGVFYAEKNINSPDGYPGNLSELEQLEAAIADALKHAENMNAVSEDIINDANAFALLSEAYAKGTRNDIPVSSGQAGYHNNSKYWSEISHQYANTVSYKKVYINVAEMVEDADLIDGQVVRTLGYHAVNDGGSALYRVESTVPTTYYETLNNGLYAKLITKNTVCPEQFGAVGNGSTDDFNSVNDCINYANANNCAIIFKKIYGVSNTITLPEYTQINGTNYHTTGIKLLTAKENLVLTNDFVSIDNITIDGNGNATDVIAVIKPYCNISRCLIRGGSNSAIKLRQTYCDVISNNRIYGGDYGIVCAFDTLTAVAYQNSITIADNIILICNKYALVIGGGDGWLIERNTIETAKLGAAIFTGFHNLKFSNNYIENCSKYSTKYTQVNETFYIRGMLVFNYSLTNDAFGTGTIGQCAVVENNFVNLDAAASDNVIPSGYEDISTFILANSVKYLTVLNNRGTTNGRKLICFGSRYSNARFDYCHAVNNEGFSTSKMLGNLYTAVVNKPMCDIDDVVKYNHFGKYDFSDVASLSLVDSGDLYYGNKIYTCSTNGTYGLLTVPLKELQTLNGKTAVIGFYAKIPTGVSIDFYMPNGIPYPGVYTITNPESVYGEWAFIGMSVNCPDTITENLKFYFKFGGISSTPIQVSRLILCELGTSPINAL